ncbi:hypothetical protein SD70_27695 [Gordoniibacillus kamchatkensis]|uniref:Uncharacterized protein n=1 Tax=Gordoniibacillus kamchatkensis TaxID=1590651 RepID=A0ABR5AAX4_9BACL|nr:hypothetical protein [Paenibacillus sp. VKM B-2647]KIL38216.1 hypothetical protein SD70_27695 [Paenibacillus sp. VKM B-2647]
MNRWHVYEFLKQTYMYSGKVPTIGEVKKHFGSRVDQSEIIEGLAEFTTVTKHVVLEKEMPKGYGKSRKRGA